MTKPAKLTKKQRLFVREYLVDLNATQAAIRAGYSAKTAHSAGPRMLTNVGVQAAIQEAMGKRAEKLELSADTVLRELARVALADVGQAYDENGQLKPFSEMPEDVRRSISYVEDTEMGRKARFWDKTKALDLLGKHLKLFTEVSSVELSGPGGKPLVAGVVILPPEEAEAFGTDDARDVLAVSDGK